MRPNRNWWIVLGPVSVLAACAATRETEPVEQEISRVEAAPVLAERFERTIAWGHGPSELRRSAKVVQSVVYGPNAVAVAADGRPLVLDRLAGRVVSVDAASPLRTVASVAVDSEDLAAGSDGTWLAFSPVRAEAAVFDAQGKSVGTIAVPRALRDAVGFDFGPSRRIRVRTGLQEVIEIGSPAAPLALDVVMQSKREGALQLADGRGLAVQATEAGVSLLLLSQPAGDDTRSETQKVIALPGAAAAGRVVGADANVVCVRTESVSSKPAISVDRRVVCVNVDSSAVVFDEALPAPGLYVPRTDVAFNAGRLAYIRPTDQGLSVTSVQVVGKAVTP
jgi:hypothetical protein